MNQDSHAQGQSAPETQVDPITSEIIRAGLVAITDEMKTNLMRTAYNLIIYEAQDFTVGLFDADGDTISIGLGLPMFIRGLSDAVKAKIAFYGIDGFEPGDILLTNDAYVMGSHLNHMIFTVPVFHEGELVAFSSSMAHWLDVGGVLGGTTTDIFSEGLQVPIVKIFKGGIQDDELTRLIAMNVRFPDLAMGDFRAQVAAIKTGESRLSQMLQRYGRDTVLDSVAAVHRRHAEAARLAVTRIPDGEYRAEAFMDDDGVTPGNDVPVRVRVVVDGDAMTIDLSEMSPQVAGYYNSGVTAGRSAAQVAFKCLTSPDLFPINDGSLEPLTVELPMGTVVSAVKPAAMRWWMTYPMTVVDCIFKALAPAMPGGTVAGHHADLGMTLCHGVDDGGRFFQFLGGPQGGGWGATKAADGRSATICVNDGDTHNAPVEVTEAKTPSVLVEEYSLIPDSGGPGRRRGGLGTRMSLQLRAPIQMNAWIERTRCAPWGLDGGSEGAANRLNVVRRNGEVVSFPSGKVQGLALQPGDKYVVELGGGGGYGDAFTRPVDDVLADVRAGYVSPERATSAYGVVLVTGNGVDPGPAAEIDLEATAQLRRSVGTSGDDMMGGST